MTTTAIVFAEPVEASPVLLGVPVLERLLRTLARAGVTHVVIVTSAPEWHPTGLATDAWARARVSLTTCTRPAEAPQVAHALEAWPAGEERALVFPFLGVFDLRAIKALVRSSHPAALVDSGSPEEHAPLLVSASHATWGLVCGPAVIDRPWLDSRRGDLASVLTAAVEVGTLPAIDVYAIPAYIPNMRRRLRPFWFPSPATEDARRQGQDVILEAAQKRVLDLPATLYAPMENGIVRAICSLGVTPNRVCLFTQVMAWIATVLFALGDLGGGIALGLLVGVLDGVGEKLARVKVETTCAGLGRGLAGLFGISWAVALAWTFYRTGVRPDAWEMLLFLLGAEALDGVAKGVISLRYHRQLDDLAPFDRAARLLGGRHNVYVWIMLIGILVGGAPDAFAVVAWWALTTAVVHVTRVAWLLSRRGSVVFDD